jgi:hypothetical protein
VTQDVSPSVEKGFSMSNNPFVELSVDRLEDCEYLPQLNSKLAEAVQAIHDYRAKYPGSMKVVRAVVSAQIEIICEPCEPKPGEPSNQARWLIETHPIDVKKPKNRPGQSMPVCLNNDDGKPTLYVQRSGAFNGEPTQLRLATTDGRGIDPATHEISPGHTPIITKTPSPTGAPCPTGAAG